MNVEEVKAKRPVEEIPLIARTEAATTAKRVLFMNQHPSTLFPHKNLGAIKGRR